MLKTQKLNNKKTLIILYKDTVLVTRVRIFCTTLFTNNNIKIVTIVIPLCSIHTWKVSLFDNEYRLWIVISLVPY